MNFLGYSYKGRATAQSIFRAGIHLVVAWWLLEFWDYLFHSLLPDFWADKAENFTAALVIIVTQFLVGLYNPPKEIYEYRDSTRVDESSCPCQKK
jgi:hypothetical protein